MIFRLTPLILSFVRYSLYINTGYVMSGSRHARMNAVRIRKENQVFSAGEYYPLNRSYYTLINRHVFCPKTLLFQPRTHSLTPS